MNEQKKAENEITCPSCEIRAREPEDFEPGLYLCPDCRNEMRRDLKNVKIKVVIRTIKILDEKYIIDRPKNPKKGGAHE